MLKTIALLLLFFGDVASYKILVMPQMSGLNSRMLNMQKMADILSQDGHQVDVIMNNRVKDHIIVKHARVINFDVPDDAIDVTKFTIEDWNLKGFNFFVMVTNFYNVQVPFCDSLFQNEALMNKIRDADYDLILADMISLCSGIITSHLNVTTIVYQNFGFWPDSRALYPLIPSFNCHSIGSVCTGDDMSFFERVLNTVFLAVSNYYMNPYVSVLQNDIANRAGIQLRLPVESIMEDRIMLQNNDYVLEVPRPTMPHVFMISGLFNKKPSPLTTEIQKIVDQSGSYGVILVSFGTLVPKFRAETAAKFARVFGKLKQQVIWRYTGKKPEGWKNNTHLIEWFPQNDLLANQATKLFITHCGISSTFESVYNGIPVVAMPLFVDQQTNAMKLTERVKSGVTLEYFSFTEDQLENAIKEVLSNPSYRENAKQASLIMSDQVVPPIQQFRHLVNFTVKTGGAKHLFHPYAVRMSWFTYFSLDVVLFLCSIIVAAITTFLLTLRIVCRMCCKSTSNKVKKQ